jgi:hypothetical protein
MLVPSGSVIVVLPPLTWAVVPSRNAVHGEQLTQDRAINNCVSRGPGFHKDCGDDEVEPRDANCWASMPRSAIRPCLKVQMTAQGNGAVRFF